MERRQESLDSIEIFAGLSPDVRHALAARCTWRVFQPHQQIVGHQEDSRTVFFLTAGKARVTIFAVDGKQVTFRDITEGDMLGEWAAIDGRPRAASVEAVNRCTVAAMSQEMFWDVIREQPAVTEIVLKRLVRQVRNLSDKVLELSTQAVRKRIQNELLRMAERVVTEEGNAVIFPAPTSADLAARVATTRETVTRELGDMSRDGLIQRKDGRTLVIPDVEKLRGIAAAPTEH